MKYFDKREFLMGDDNVHHMMNPKLLEHLDNIREIIDQPINITSSYRDTEYNRSVGGKDSSQHILGKAVDIQTMFSGSVLMAIMYYCLEQGLSLGIDKTFLHIDCREKQTMWVY